MKITDVETIPVGMELKEPLRWGAMETNTVGSVLVLVHTDDGIAGCGEAGFSVDFFAQVKTVIDIYLKPLLIGQDPLNIGSLWKQMFDTTHKWGRRGIETYALSGVEIALYDILGKATGKPVFRLLGAHKTQVPAYWAPSLKDAEVIAEECKQAVAEGFRAIKLRAGLGTREDLEIVKTVREAVGDDVLLAVDPNMAYDLHKAIDMIRRFSEYGIEWIEEPIRAKSLTQYIDLHAHLAERVDVPISGGECLFTTHEFTGIFTRNAFAIVQPDTTGVGGISECYKVGVIANAFNVLCVPHVACSSVAGIGLAANLHVICSLPNTPWLEYPAYDFPIKDELFTEPIKVKDGEVVVSEKPGLGLELDPKALARYRVDSS